MADPDRVLVVAAADPRAIRSVPSADLTIAADGGLDVARALGLEVDAVVGDMDSVDPATLAEAEAAGVDVDRHARAKDESDLELALGRARSAAPRAIHVLVGSGGRLDHALANLLVLASPRWAPAEVSADVGGDAVWVVRGHRRLPLRVGDPLALQPVGGPATGVTTEGLAYPLRDDTLDPLAARGIANEVVSAPVEVTVARGVVLAISATRPSTAPGAAPGRG